MRAWTFAGMACAAIAVARNPAIAAPFSLDVPDELRFSDFGKPESEDAEKYARALAEGDPPDGLTAARRLWRGHSRPRAVEVLKFLAGPPPGGEEFRAFQREVEAALRPDAILKEMKEGDYAWGAWLAFLRPHKDLVPALLAALKDRPNDLPETSLALGNSGDPRALEPLLALVKAKDYRASGDAAFAIGYLGDPKAEPVLIQALTESGWPQLQASRALAVLGSSKALPALEKLADEGSRGALNITGMARDAIVRIERRHSIRDPARWPNAPGPEPRVTLRGHGAPVWALAFSPDGKTLASVGDDQAVRLWDPSTGKATAAFAGPGRQTTEVAFAGTGKIAVAGWTEDGSIHLLDARSGRETGTIPVNKGGVGSLVASADCKLLAASGSGGNEEETVRVFDSVTGKVVATLPKAARALVFSPDGKTLATAGGTGATDVQLWDLGTGKVVNTLHSHTEAVVSASFSPDGRVLASGGDWTVRVWNLRTGKETAKFRGDSEVFGVPFDRDGRRVAAAEAGGMVRLWDVSAGRAVATLAARGPVAYSPDGTTLATAAPDSRALLLWSVDK